MNREIIRIMVVDDHPMVRKGLAMFVAGNPDMRLVGEAGNVADALEAFERLTPDVVLMDMVMPDADGAAAIRQIRDKHPEASVIALTSFGEEQLIESALRAGARGFLYKNIGVDELADAIRQVHHGRTILDSKAALVMQRLLDGSDSPAPASKRTALSERESSVLQLLGQGLTNKQIAAHLNLQPSTVKQYIGNILAKLNVQSRTEAVALGLKLGLIHHT